MATTAFQPLAGLEGNAQAAERLRDPWLVRAGDAATRTAGALAGVVLLVMIGVILWEVFTRFVLNAPTAWVTEVAAYLLVALVFLGLASAEKAGAHIQVELVLGYLKPPLRQRLNLVSGWLGVFFALFMAWQIVAFNASEYANGTRSWGLMSTPQWMPQLPMSIGFSLFVVAILCTCLRQAPRLGALRQVLVVGTLAALVVTLWQFGQVPVQVGRVRIDAGVLAICAAWLVLTSLGSGLRIAAAAAAILFVLGSGFAAVKGGGALLVGSVLMVAILAVLLMGVRISLALGLVALVGLLLLLPRPQLSALSERAWTSVNTFTLTAVPMFVLMSALLLRSGVTTLMFDSLVKWFGRVPGGLAHASAGASTIFAAVSGSSIATAAALGKVACPEMVERGYSPRLAYGVTAAGATLGIMIPPSIAMIIYGSTVGAPINVLFIAGIVPGLLLAIGFMAVALVWALLSPGAAPRGNRYTMGEKIRSLANILPFTTVIAAVLGSIYAGIATPTEAAALGVLMAAVLCVFSRTFSWRMLREVTAETINVSAFVLLIVICAAALSWLFDYLRLPQSIVEYMRGAQLAPWMVIAAMAGIYLVLGMFVESISMMLMTLPVAYPVVIALGFDPIWFGIFLVLMIETGLITPPLGIVLFVLRGLSGKVPLSDIAIGALPFVCLLLSFVVLMYIYPELISWLPDKMK